jgi:hypothetical protein
VVMAAAVTAAMGGASDDGDACRVSDGADTFTDGLRPLAAVAMPEMSPPPPTGTMMASSPGTCGAQWWQSRQRMAD